MNHNIKSSVVRILSQSNEIVGVGFLISNKHVMTCAHVVAAVLNVSDESPDAPDGVISFDFPLVAPGTFIKGRVVSWCPVRASNMISPQIAEDIAVIEVSGALPGGCRPAQFATTDDLWDHDFRTFGFLLASMRECGPMVN